ncbi:hypothetical protein [Microbacterium jepli]|uniref:hypothetical protein n=1 Tax=Microbacterium sp. 1P10UE TaxID=3132288 RepID=UPI0039A2FA39
MDTQKSMVRHSIAIDDVTFLLAQEQDVPALKTAIEGAAGTSGTFVNFTVVGDRGVSVLVTGTSRVVIAEETVAFDARDTGDIEALFGDFFDIPME